MNGEGFELETRLRSLSISDGDSTTNEQELADLIASCVADVEPHNDSGNEGRHSPAEMKDGDLPTSLIVTNLPNSLFYEQDMKVTCNQHVMSRRRVIRGFPAGRAGIAVQSDRPYGHFPLPEELQEGQGGLCFLRDSY